MLAIIVDDDDDDDVRYGNFVWVFISSFIIYNENHLIGTRHIQMQIWYSTILNSEGHTED